MRYSSTAFSSLDIAAKLTMREAMFTTAAMDLAREYSIREQGRSNPDAIKRDESARDNMRANLYAARPDLFRRGT